MQTINQNLMWKCMVDQSICMWVVQQTTLSSMYFILMQSFFICLHSANISLQIHTLDQQHRLQSSRREDFVWQSRNQVTDLLEHTFFQDLYRYEDRPADQIPCHQQACELSVLTDRWREISQNLTGSQQVEDAFGVSSLLAGQLQHGGVQCCGWWIQSKNRYPW